MTNQRSISDESPHAVSKINSKHLPIYLEWIKNKQTAVITALAISVFSCSVGATNHNKLLPSTETAKIKIIWRLDGRAQFVTVKNDSRLAFTSATLACYAYNTTKPRPERSPNGKNWCGTDTMGNLGRLTGECDDGSLRERSLNETVLPGKSKEFYFEVDEGSLPPVSCHLRDLRGREPKFWEF